MPSKKRTASEALQSPTGQRSRVEANTSEEAETEPSARQLTKAALTSEGDGTTTSEPAAKTATTSAEKGKAVVDAKQNSETTSAIGIGEVNDAGKTLKKAKIEDDKKEKDDGPSYWLMKSDPTSFSIDHIFEKKEPEIWKGKS